MKRWRTMTQVERVEAYTHLSLLLMTWLFPPLLLVPVLVEKSASSTTVIVVGVATTASCLATTLVGRALYARDPEAPLPVRPLLLLAVVATTVLAVAATRPELSRVALTAAVLYSAPWALGALGDRRVDVGSTLLAGALMGLASGDLRSSVVAAGVVAFVIFTVRASLWIDTAVRDVDAARETTAALAVAEERLRFSRDVHDVMGRRLSTIAVQSELAATLARRGDDRAEEQMLAVRTLAHEALREARELARGYRPVDLAHELDGARSLLRSAGIEVDLDVDGVPEHWQEPAAWVVREAVTNVLRHSAATRVRIAYGGGELVVTNDRATSTGDGRGAGIAGLRERLAPLGATVAAGAGPDATYALAVTLPREEATT